MKVRRRSAPINPPRGSRRTMSRRGCSLRMYYWATPYPHLGWGMGRLPMNMGSGTSASFFRKNHTFHHPTGGTDIKKQKDGLTLDPDRTKMVTLPLPRLSPAIAGHGRSSSISRCGAQSPCCTHTGSWRLLYAGSPKESSDAAPSHRTTAASGQIDVTSHQIIARRRPCMPRCITPTELEMQDPQAHDRYLTLLLSYTPDISGFASAPEWPLML
jgi:hypothetical protein